MNDYQNQGAIQPQALDVSVKVYPTSAQEDSKRLATASVTLGGCFAIRGVQIMDSDRGAFVSMPQRKDGKGEYHDICFPVTKEMREAINTAVLEEYQATMERAFSRAGQSMERRANMQDQQDYAPRQDMYGPQQGYGQPQGDYGRQQGGYAQRQGGFPPQQEAPAQPPRDSAMDKLKQKGQEVARNTRNTPAPGRNRPTDRGSR